MKLPQVGRGASPLLFIIVIAAVILLFKPLADFFKSFFGGITNVGSNISEGLGFSKSDTEKKAQQESSSVGSCWSYSYFKNVPAGTKLFTYADSAKMCEAIHDSRGFVYASITELLNQLKKCSSKAQISFLCFRFNEIYSLDMLSYITTADYLGFIPIGLDGHSNFSDSEKKQVLDWVDSLPKYS